MAVEDMKQATLALLAYVREGRPSVGPNPLPRALVPWEADLRTQERGGSANKGKLAWLLEYIRGNPEARTYWIDCLRWELARGLMAHEQLSPTYGGLHLGCVVLLWYIAWSRGDLEICRLAGAWLERVLLLECLCDGNPPGMRADHRSVTEGRKVEKATTGLLLGQPQSLRLDHDDWWGPLWQAVQACEGVGLVAGRVGALGRSFLRSKPRPSTMPNLPDIMRIRLMVPMRFHAWPNGDWFAWIPKGGGQDPPCMGSGWINGEHVVLWPWEDGSDPPEEGWRASASMGLGDDGEVVVEAFWSRKGQGFAEAFSPDLGGPEYETIGSPSGPVPLGDLPPAPDPRRHPWRQGGRPGTLPDPEPEESVELPEDVKAVTWGHVTKHPRRTLVLVRRVMQAARTGRWEGVEREAAKWWEEVRGG